MTFPRSWRRATLAAAWAVAAFGCVHFGLAATAGEEKLAEPAEVKAEAEAEKVAEEAQPAAAAPAVEAAPVLEAAVEVLEQVVRPIGGPIAARMAKPAPAEAKPDDKKKKKEEEDEAIVEIPAARRAPADGVMLHLMDGSMLSGKMTIQDIQVATEFGLLKVPVNSIRTFTPGLGSHPELFAKVTDLIEDLGSSDFSEREGAQKALLELGVQVRAELEKRSSDSDVERRSRVRKILAELDELERVEDEDYENQAPSARGVLIQRDTIETTEFTIVGQISPKTFQILSKYGPLSVNLSDIRKAERDLGGRPELRKTMGVDGANLVQNNTKTSGIRLSRGDRVMVNADGNITMTPWGNEAVVTPDGSQQYGWYLPGQIPGGSLVARIGDGPVFKVGSKASFVAERSGVLEFGVGVQNDYVNNMFPGRYTVRIRVKPKN